MPEPTPAWDTAIDKLRTIAILAVILTHTSSRTLEMVNFNIVAVPWTLILNQSVRFCVPLFFLISGFVLELSYKPQTGYFSYLKKRLGKLFLPYIFWSAVYYYFVYTVHHSGFLSTLVNGSSSYQLYFIPSLLLFYLVFPLLHRVLGWLGKWWVFLILTAVQLWLLYLDYYQRGISLFDPLRICLLNYQFFIIGMLAARNTDRLKYWAGKIRYMLLIMPVLLVAYLFYESRSRYLASWNYIEIYSQWRPSIFALTVSLFVGGY